MDVVFRIEGIVCRKLYSIEEGLVEGIRRRGDSVKKVGCYRKKKVRSRGPGVCGACLLRGDSHGLEWGALWYGDEKRSGKIGRSGSSNHRVGRSGSRNWNSVWCLYYWKVTKPIKGGNEV